MLVTAAMMMIAYLFGLDSVFEYLFVQSDLLSYVRYEFLLLIVTVVKKPLIILDLVIY